MHGEKCLLGALAEVIDNDHDDRECSCMVNRFAKEFAKHEAAIR